MTATALRQLLGEQIRGKAHGGVGGHLGGLPFEGRLVGIADTPQAIIEDAEGRKRYLTIETIAELEVERRSWERVA